MQLRGKILVLLCLLSIMASAIGCSALDPLKESVYFEEPIYTWNGTAWNQVIGGGGIGVEVDPVWTASDAFGITAADIAGWTGHPPLTTGTHGVTGTIMGTSDVQNVTHKSLTMDNNEPIYWDDTLGNDMEVFNIWLDNNLDILYNEDANIFIWEGSGTGQTMYLWPEGSTALSTLKDSPTLDFNANYWDTTNKNWEAKIIHDMRTAGVVPKSWLKFSINGEDILRLENDTGVVKSYFDGVLDMTTHQINNVVDPTLAQDAATKFYVDTSITGNVTGFVPYIGATNTLDLGSENLTTANTIFMSQIGVEPTSTADRAGIYAWDLPSSFTDNFDTDTWTDIGAGSLISVNTTASRIDYTADLSATDYRTYKDYGLTSNTIWNMEFTFYLTSDVGVAAIFAYGLWDGLHNYNGYHGDAIICYAADQGAGVVKVALVRLDGGGSGASALIAINTGTTYYVRLQRNTAILATLTFFSDAAMTIPVAGFPLTLAIPTTVVDLRYVAGSNSNTGGGAGNNIVGWIDTFSINGVVTAGTTMGFYTEMAVQSALGVASTNRIPIRWNGNTYYLLVEASGFRTPIVNSVEPTLEQGVQIDMVFFNTTTNTWKKCTSISPLTWTTLSSGGATAWGSITGTLSAQTDLNNALNGKLSSITGMALDNVFSSNGLLKRTGTGTYTIDASAYLTSFTELDPVFGGSVAHEISSGDITNWNNKLSSFTELDPFWVASASYGIVLGDITNWNNKLSAITGVGLDNVFSSNGLLKRTGVATYTLDTSTYLTGNQNITLSGDLSGSGTTSISGTVTGIQGKGITLATGYLYYSGSAWAFQTPAGGTHNLLDGSTHLDTTAGTVARGDVITGQGTTAKWTKLLKGTANQVLSMDATGTDVLWATVAGGSPNPLTTIDISEEFITGLLTTGNIGDLGWSFLTTAPTYQASVANHLGIRRMVTSATINTVNAFYLGSTASNDNIQFGDLCDFTFVVQISDITTMATFVGAMDIMTTAVGNQDRYGFSYIAGTDTYWMMTTGAGSASTRTATNISVVANTWYTLRVVRTTTGVDYYINGVSKGTITTTLPDTALSFGFHLQTLVAGARYLDCDFFRMTLGVTR